MKKVAILFVLLLACTINGFSQIKVGGNGDTFVKYGTFAPGNDAILFLGNTDHYIKSTFGYGIKLGTAGCPDWLILRQYSGWVGIGGDPQYTLDVAGTIRANTTLYSSDKR